MDRNPKKERLGLAQRVALRKESVDRNIITTKPRQSQAVALRKESVDRNQAADISARREARSLSARRAWIEMLGTVMDDGAVGGRSPQGERG